MSTVRVKICGLTREQDLHASIAAGADALGFVFTPRSKRFLEPGRGAELVRQVPAFVTRVGLFMDQSAEEVKQVLEQVPLSLLQFHGSEGAAYCRQFGRPYLKAVSMAEPDALQAACQEFDDAAALLLDSHVVGEAGGTGTVFDWRLVQMANIPLVLAGGLKPENVRQAVEQVRPWAVDVSSGVEDAPGIKNAEKLRKFIREAKREQ